MNKIELLQSKKYKKDIVYQLVRCDCEKCDAAAYGYVVRQRNYYYADNEYDKFELPDGWGFFIDHFVCPFHNPESKNGWHEIIERFRRATETEYDRRYHKKVKGKWYG